MPGPKYYNTSIRNLEYRLRAFRDKLSMYLEEAVRDNESVIVGMIAESQLYDKGITGMGRSIADYAPYAPKTIALKRKKGQPTNRVTLRDTGAFYAGMRVIFDAGGFRITSDDRKTEELVDKYGPEIFRLSNNNLSILLREHIRPALISKLRQNIQS